MSVINTMLKDLEQRGGKRDLSKEEILQGLSSATAGIVRRSGLNPYLISLFSVLALCAVLVLAYFYSPYRLVTAQTGEGPLPVAEAPTTIQASPGKDTLVAEQTAAVAEAEKRSPETLQLASDASALSVNNVTAQSARPIQAQITARTVAAPINENKAAPVNKHTKVEQAKTETAHRAEKVAQVEVAGSVPAPPESEDDAVISKTPREPSRSEKSANAYAAAMSLFNQGRTDASRLQLKQALGHDPSNSKAGQLLAAIYLADNRPELAVDTLDTALKLRPADQDLLRMYLQVQVRMKNYAQAISIMEQRIRVNSPEDIAYLAGLYQKSNDHLGAARLYAQALKMKPSNSIWWMGQGISFEALGKSEEAMKSYQQSISSGRLNTQLAEYVLGRIASIEKTTRDSMS